MIPRFVTYLRVSTAKQGASGLGLEAQRKACADFVVGRGGKAMAEFVEVESGKNDDRPKLKEAMAMAVATGSILLIAKLDRLSRDAHFLLSLQKDGLKFVAADMPEANEMVVGIMAVIAQAERQMISQRTKEALQAAKARGVRLGNPNGGKHLASLGVDEATAARIEKADGRANDLIVQIRSLEASGIVSANGLAKALNERGILTPSRREGAQWTAKAVQRVRERIA